MNAMAISLTERAARQMQRSLAGRGAGVGIRLAVTTSGCAGMRYVMEYADALEPEDRCFESHGVTVVVDARSLPYLTGVELDFVREGLNEGFRFNNPNAASACGCGESFSVSA